MFLAGPSADGLIVLAPVDQHGASAPMLPFTFESRADVIAIAVMGEPQSRGRQQVMRMELVEVLKGRQQVDPLESADGVAPFGCIMPKNPKRFSDMYKAGERVAVYLKKNGDEWSTLQMTHLTEQYERQWEAGVRPFLDVLLASESDAPEQRYEELLVAQAPRPQLTEASYYALNFNPDPRAAPLVRKMMLASMGPENLQQFNQRIMNRTQVDRGQVEANASALQMRLQQQVVKSLQTAPNAQQTDSQQTKISPQRTVGDPSDTEVGQKKQRQVNLQTPTTFPNTPLDRVTLLAKMHDAESVLPVMAHISRLSDNERYPFIQLLPNLCRDADAGVLRVVEAELDRYVESYQGDQQHYYYRELVRVRTSIDKMLEEVPED